ncbi:hypothetical protein K461DRAFT_317336 [Myriangium duriaei CBS 260.36]|uniref:Peptidase S33 tripeptidyl aminopeptidase-like C-terminal domain-containing protein n=1 Tax=Myriangium duriaei CBS 260.36 TaxID=1168546 RepID=A0A9P4MLB6_9PEZI|nr:hypothetical protein K461DRAFT_317336 [Myriangium duriaei CBS 260.36]
MRLISPREKGEIALPIDNDANLNSRAPPKRWASMLWKIAINFTAYTIILLVSGYLAKATVSTIWRSAGWRHVSGKTLPPFDWDKIETLPELSYRPCYDGLQCARLEVPMDYWNGTTDKTVSLAVVRLPATVRIDDPRYRGPILVNPGGPGGSGISMVWRAGGILQSIVQGTFPDLEQPQFYDIIGFDPRGVGYTSPPVTCSGGPSKFAPWRMRVMQEGSLSSSDASFGRLWQMSAAMSGRCSDIADDSIQRYLSTAYVARDMLEIVEASAKWRQNQLRQVGSSIVVKPEEEKIQYWGFSYGSYLGYTFASMFPDRVGRLVVDGVVDAEDYTGAHWLSNLVDTEKCFDNFFYHCARVGYPNCSLADQNEPTPQKIKQRTQDIIQNMWHNPIPILEPYAEVVTWTDIRNLIFASVYSPVASYPFLANVLAELERGEASLLAKVLQPYHSFSCDATIGPGGHPFFTPLYNTSFGKDTSDPFRGAAIACSDGDSKADKSRADFSDYVDQLMELSPSIGDLWGSIMLPCAGYKVRPVHRYTGPWTGDTANPVLFIGNTADPVTPVRNCKTLAPGFKGAKVLTQDSPGHCSLAAYSKCTVSHISGYFFNGTMPEDGTVCGADVVPWGSGIGLEAQSPGLLKAAELHGLLGQAVIAAGGGTGLHHATGKLDHVRMLAEQVHHR